MRHVTRILAVATAAVITLGGCGQATGSGSAPQSAQDQSGPLVVYTNSNSEGRGEWLQAKAKDAGFDIKIVGAGGGDLANKLSAEKNNPVADVVYGLNNVYFEQLKAQDILAPYTPSWAGDVDAKYGDQSQDKAYWPLVQQAIVLSYNAGKVTKEQAPTDWPDLWTKDQYKTRYERVTGTGAATTQLVLAGILSRYRDDKGELGVSAEGWNQIKQYFANGVPAAAGTDLFARFAKGEVDYGQMPSSSIPGREKAYGVEAGAVIPAVGVPYAVEQVAVIKGTKRQQSAQKFIDWFGSADIQSQWAQKFDSLPVNTKALPAAKPEAVAFDKQFKHQDIDWAFVGKNLNSWMEKIQLEYMK
jgi:iron(III) transport system substrate-binding protein